MRVFCLTMFLALAAVALAAVAPAAAQLPWDGTTSLAPDSPESLGISILDPGDGGNFAVEGMWRRSPAPVGFGLRVGVGENLADDIAVYGGVDLSGTILTPTSDLPIGMIWLFGAGASVGEEVWAAFPVGLSVGANLESEGISFRPYIVPRIDLDIMSGPGDSMDLNAAVDVGLDLEFDPSWVIRFSAAFGDRDAIKIGVTFPQIGR